MHTVEKQRDRGHLRKQSWFWVWVWVWVAVVVVVVVVVVEIVTRNPHGPNKI